MNGSTKPGCPECGTRLRCPKCGKTLNWQNYYCWNCRRVDEEGAYCPLCDLFIPLLATGEIK